jgi:murein DD-endopeptidase MepM/ murein hydrolase activator NlpD
MDVEKLARAAILGLALTLVVGFLFFISPMNVGSAPPSAHAAIIDSDFPLRPAIPAARSDSALEEEATQPIRRKLTVEPGDTLALLVTGAGVANQDAHAAIQVLRKHYNPRDLRAGQAVTVTFAPDKHGLGIGPFHGLELEPDATREVAVARQPEGGFAANVLSAMVRALSFDVDFQRDIQPGDGFAVLFERLLDERGRVARDGELAVVSLTLSGKPLVLYRHTAADGETDFFNVKGESVKKALLRTPVDGAKLTSRFGKRRHPILGFDRLHKGIDFGLPIGAPVQAAGDGTVEFAGKNGAYGNYVRIRHSGTYSTAYAHLNGFAGAAKVGRKVRQGQVIGYVGTTGMSTGPHLHYEVLVSNKAVNPLSIKMPSGRKLEGVELARFEKTRQAADRLYAKAPAIERLAKAE